MDLYPRTAWKGGKSPDHGENEVQNESKGGAPATGTTEDVASDMQGMAENEAGDSAEKADVV